MSKLLFTSKDVAAVVDVADRRLAEVKRLEAEVARLRTALEFYADPCNYTVTGYERRYSCPCAVEADQGKWARSALESAR